MIGLNRNNYIIMSLSIIHKFMPQNKMAKFSEELWQIAFQNVKELFKIENLHQEQVEGIKAFFETSSHVFINLPTGFGKSMIFQSLPLIADCLYGRPRGSCTLVVISPLQALIKDQVDYLQNLSFPAISIVDDTCDDTDIIQMVINGVYTHVYISPECLLASKAWRDIFVAPEFCETLVGVAVDEAHCVVQWGLPGQQKVPFRKWYGFLGEMTSLIPTKSKLIILTATATKATQAEIMETLHITDVHIIERSPDRPNLMYILTYMDKYIPLEDIFYWLVKQVKMLNVDTERVLIYCQTRKQCFVLFRMFEVCLGEKMYHGSPIPQNRIVEMFHAGTPISVKTHIAENMTFDNGHIRVLIATVAFGMGVNCKKIRRVIHFGPSRNLEQYVQECGRAGRDGALSSCTLLFNGVLSTRCGKDMKDFLHLQECRRQSLMHHFGFVSNKTNSILHLCCDICASSCNCGSDDCGKYWSAEVSKFIVNNEPYRTRKVRDEQKQDLQTHLLNYVSLLQHSNTSDYKVPCCPSVILEFNSFHVQQVLNNCHLLFTMKDVLKHCEIWHKKYATAIMKILGEVFDDMEEYYEDNEMFEDKENSTIVSYEPVWDDIRNDSSLYSIADQSMELSDDENSQDTLEMSISFQGNNSSLFEMLAPKY